eukprot:RCo043509
MLGEGKFISNGYKDVFFAVVFVVHLIGILVLACYSFATLNWKHSASLGGRLGDGQAFNPEDMLIAVGASIGTALVSAIVLLLLLKTFAREFIVASQIIQLLAQAAGFIVALLQGVPELAIIAAVFLVMNLLWLGVVWRRIQFSSVILASAAEVIFAFPGTICVAFAGVVVTVVYFVAWAATVDMLWNRYSGLKPVLLLSLFWSCQVWKNIVHVAVAGTVATWYFLCNNMPVWPTAGAVRRATTTSLGSICLGSLFVSLVQLTRAAVQSMRGSRNSFVAMCLDCLLGFVDSLMQYFNEYAYCQVAIYGKGFLEAARDTWTLVQNCGLTAVINDNLISTTLVMVSVVLSLLAGLTAALVPRDSGNYWNYVLLGTAIALFILLTVMSTLNSAIITIFICYAEEPQALEFSNRELAEQLREAVSRISTGHPYFAVSQPLIAFPISQNQPYHHV